MKAAKKAATVPSSKRTGLSKAARDLLARVRASPSPERVFGLEPAAADAMARGVIDPLIDGAALPLSKLGGAGHFLISCVSGENPGSVTGWNP